MVTYDSQGRTKYRSNRFFVYISRYDCRSLLSLSLSLQKMRWYLKLPFFFLFFFIRRLLKENDDDYNPRFIRNQRSFEE